MFIRTKRALRNNKVLVAIYQATLLKWRPYQVWNEKRSRQVIMTPYGFKLVGSTLDGSNAAMLHGEFETQETAILRKYLEQSETFIDIGANIGLYTCLARHIGKHVIAVEPQHRNLDCLYSSLLTNNWPDVEVFPMGLSDHAGLVKLFGDTGPSASLVEGWANFSSNYTQVISATTLDNLVGNRINGRNIVIKIDVEGAEYSVLCGAQNTLRLNPRPTWMIEICLDQFHPGNCNPHYEATFELFWQAGYTAYTAESETREVTPSDVNQWVKQNRCPYGVYNFIFTSK